MNYWSIGEVLQRVKGAGCNRQSQDPRGVGDENEKAEMWLRSLLSHLLTMMWLWANVINSLSTTFSVYNVGLKISPANMAAMN